jgi:hypothetical protein
LNNLVQPDLFYWRARTAAQVPLNDAINCHGQPMMFVNGKGRCRTSGYAGAAQLENTRSAVPK